MNRARIFSLFGLLLLLCALCQSCGKKDLFDKELYRYIVRSNYPVDTLESDHPWTLLQRRTISAFANVGDKSASEVRIYDGHPSADASARMLARADISTGGRATLTFDADQTQELFYAVLSARSGTSYVETVDAFQGGVVFTEQSPAYRNLPEPQPQTFTYVYESNFPMPDDFDYNDVVLRVGRTVPQPNILQLHVTLAAAGCYQKVAAAIRLPGIGYDDVERIEIAEGTRLDADYPLPMSMLTSAAPLLRSRGGEAVVPLFEDAHWALGHSYDKTSTIPHVPYNTDRFAEVQEPPVNMPEQSRTYNIYMKLGVSLDSLLLADLDPFIVETYSVVNFEVHPYRYKFEEVLWEYLGDDKRAYDDFLAWALVIPSGSFRHPVETVPLGTFRDGELYGAYGLQGHAFGQWGRDYRKARDWWKHPNAALVY